MITTRQKIEAIAREHGWIKQRRFSKGDRFSVYHDTRLGRYVHVVWTRDDKVHTASIRKGTERVEWRITNREPHKAETVIGWLTRELAYN